jgi:hypothetical protein
MAIVVRENTDANKFFNAAGIVRTEANIPIIIAISQLTSDLKQYGIWDKMKAIYPMVGQAGVSSSFEVNLKDPTRFRGVFYGGWTFSSMGATSDGSNGSYMDTGLIPSTVLSLNNASLGFYGGNNLGQQNDKPAMGSYVSSNSQFNIYPASIGVGFYGGVNDANSTTTSNSNTSGFIFATRTSPTQKIHSIRGTQTVVSSTTNSVSNLPVVIGAININEVIREFSQFQHRFNFIGDGLTDTEATNLYTAVQRFQTTLGRQV